MSAATFADLGLDPRLLDALARLGYEEPTHVQREAIPLLLTGRDMLAQAATGTGKTAGFALPLLSRLPDERAKPGQPYVLALVPTRELANQVAEAFHRYGGGAGRVVVPIYGGQDFRRQVMALRRGAHVVVATPGRALDHLRQETLGLGALQAVVLDEADEMLDMGFAEDIEAILGLAPDDCQVALFSATMPPRIAAIAATHLANPAHVRIAQERTPEGEAPRVRQTAYFVPRAHKVPALGRVLDVESPELALVFCRTRLEVDELAQTLGGHGFRVEAIHGGMSQEQRERVMKNARGGQVDLLVATDVAARGIDIGHLSHVVNFGVPESPETYVHRIGRTGRAGREGVAMRTSTPDSFAIAPTRSPGRSPARRPTLTRSRTMPFDCRSGWRGPRSGASPRARVSPSRRGARSSPRRSRGRPRSSACDDRSGISSSPVAAPAIDLADHYSLVEVDEALADRVAGALSRTWLRGQKPEVSRFDPAGAAEPSGTYRGGRRPPGAPPRSPRPHRSPPKR